MKHALPLIAILRGICEDEIIDYAKILLDSGYNMIEVPLNSPQAFLSIKKLVHYCGKSENKTYIGAGTITQVEHVKKLKETGANLAVMPHLNINILKALVQENFLTYPGVFSPSEAFEALEYKPEGLKIFPADTFGAAYIKNIRAVLPKEAQIYPVGGVDVTNMYDFWKAGANGFGLGSSLYKPKKSLEDFKKSSEELMQEFQKLKDI